jgi:AraC-like DNA-binding protein
MKPLPIPSFDTWTSIFLIIAVQGFFTGMIMLLNNRGDREANKYIAFILFLFAVSMVEYTFYWSHYLRFYPFLLNISITFLFLFGLFLFLYFKKLFLKHSFKREDVVHFIPFFLDFAFWLPFYIANNGKERNAFFQKYMGFIEFMPWVRIVHMLIYAVLCFILIKNYSGLNEIKVWSKRVVYFFMGYIFSFISYFVLVRFPFFNTDWDYAISFSMSAFIFLVAAYGYIQPEIFQGTALSNYKALIPPLSFSGYFKGEKYKSSSLTAQASESLLMRLNELMEKEKLYCDNDLNLDKLSEKLNANRHHVSQVINEKIGVNFFDYINQLRIEQAKMLLLKNGKIPMNIIDIAYTVGFNNKVTFNTTFKNKTGMTPTEFRAQQKGKPLSELTH